MTHLMAGAVVGPDGVPTDVLTAPVVGGALVLVGEEDGGEPVLLYGVIGQKLQPQAVALRGDHLQYNSLPNIFHFILNMKFSARFLLQDLLGPSCLIGIHFVN